MVTLYRYSYEQMKQDEANEARLPSRFGRRDSLALRPARRNIKGEGESKAKVLGRARLLALARRDEGETRIDRYPPASCALIAIPALVFARTLFPSVRYSPPPPPSSSSSSLLSSSRANFPPRGGGEWPSYRAS